ncbi:MAG TPA: ribonuclease H-like YkuK family protein [Patescibacteria group bacterium]|nr:ribonuclease H-like YkuK family protein [Patescibacteria group bacterium]
MYNSPSFGKLDSASLKKRISVYMTEKKEANYRIIVGADSQKARVNNYDFVVAIVIHRVGSGGIYFWKRNVVSQKMSLKERMYQEAILSLQSAEKVFELLRENGISKYNIEIHVDIGRKGETRELISEIVGMVRGSGYSVKIKPDSFGASKVADRHT